MNKQAPPTPQEPDDRSSGDRNLAAYRDVLTAYQQQIPTDNFLAHELQRDLLELVDVAYAFASMLLGAAQYAPELEAKLGITEFVGARVLGKQILAARVRYGLDETKTGETTPAPHGKRETP